VPPAPESLNAERGSTRGERLDGVRADEAFLKRNVIFESRSLIAL
jgi:hypothetical protein